MGVIRNVWAALAAALALGAAPGVRAEPPAASGVDFKGDAFQLKLGGDWRQIPDADPEVFDFQSDAEKTVVVISAHPLGLPRARLMDGARELAKLRREEEQAARPGRTVVFGDSWVEPVEDGDAAHVAYAGYDEDSIFRFMGWVTQAKILSLWVSTDGHDNEAAKRVFEEVFAGFKFYIP